MTGGGLPSARVWVVRVPEGEWAVRIPAHSPAGARAGPGPPTGHPRACETATSDGRLIRLRGVCVWEAGGGGGGGRRCLPHRALTLPRLWQEKAGAAHDEGSSFGGCSRAAGRRSWQELRSTRHAGGLAHVLKHGAPRRRPLRPRSGSPSRPACRASSRRSRRLLACRFGRGAGALCAQSKRGGAKNIRCIFFYFFDLVQFISSFRPNPWLSCSCAKESNVGACEPICNKDDNRYVVQKALNKEMMAKERLLRVARRVGSALGCTSGGVLGAAPRMSSRKPARR